MKPLLVFALAAVFTLNVLGEDNQSREVTVQDLQEDKVTREVKITVLGQLGVPLLTVAKVEGVIVSGNDMLVEYRLRIVSVNGHKLLAQPEMLFEPTPPLSNKFLPNNIHDLYQVVNRKKEKGEMSVAEIRALEKGFIGKSVVLFVYEVGDFSGNPKGLPPGYVFRQVPYNGFHTSLRLLGDEHFWINNGGEGEFGNRK